MKLEFLGVLLFFFLLLYIFIVFLGFLDFFVFGEFVGVFLLFFVGCVVIRGIDRMMLFLVFI